MIIFEHATFSLYCSCYACRTRKVRRRLLPACSLDWDMKGSDLPVLYLLLPQNLDLHTRVKVTTSLRAVPREVLDLDANLYERINQLANGIQ